MKSFRTETDALRDQLVAWRRDFHRHPEIAFEEYRTAGIVADTLRQLGLEVQSGVGKTGVVGILEGDTEGPTVLVRADMDALPIHEANQTDYISLTANKMHACGHDGHTAIALGVATMLSQKRNELKGRVKFVFQPAEEVAGGAKAMIADGALLAPKPDVTLGLHLWNDLSLGEVAVTDGACMASAADFVLTVTGRGGHAGVPQQTHDPIVAMAQIISAAQSIVARTVDPLDTAVLSFTKVHGGDAFNVIPEQVTAAGTIRTYHLETYHAIVERFTKLAEGIAASMGCSATLESELLTPPVINDTTIGANLRRAFPLVDTRVQSIRDDVRTMGAEDVSYFLQEVPGVYFFVGSANAERGLNYPHHHPRFDVDEEALLIAANLLTSAVGDYVLPE